MLVLIAAAIMTAVIGCATPGEPTPRHPVVPQTVQNLTARQQGDAVVLDFALPVTSTEREPLPATPTIEIYRAVFAPSSTIASGAPAQTAPPRLVDTIPGDSVETYQTDGSIEFADPLAADEIAANAGRDFVYTVRTRVSKARASADSNWATVQVYPPPVPIADLRARSTEHAIVLDWTAPQQTTTGSQLSNLGYRVYRADLGTSTAAAVPESGESQMQPALMFLANTQATQFQDTGFEFNHTYEYRVRSFAQVGSTSVESGDSNLVTISPKDVFPPATPRDLSATVIPGIQEAAAYVELTWGISLEPDLAGYVVYRSEREDALGQRLNPELLPAPAYRDVSVVPGRKYFYCVAAVDRAGNESAPTAAIAVEVPGQ